MKGEGRKLGAMKIRTRLAAVVLLMCPALPEALAAQDNGLDPELLARCGGLADANLGLLCRDAVAGLQLLQPELGLALAGGNPLLGTASPIGKRFRVLPRIHLDGRVNFVWAEVPDILTYPDDTASPLGTRSFAVPMPQLNLSVGVFGGYEMTPSLGGLLSVEVIGSLGSLILPGGKGFANDAAGYGLGARIGVLRESFTAPGISLSGTYRWFGRIQFGDVEDGSDAEFGMDVSVFSFRAGVSKSFVALGLAFTLGYDAYDSDVDIAIIDPAAATANAVIPVIPEDDRGDLDSGRWSAFVDASYIVLFLNFVGELGWQEERTVVTSRDRELQAGNFFGSIGVRLSL